MNDDTIYRWTCTNLFGSHELDIAVDSGLHRWARACAEQVAWAEKRRLGKHHHEPLTKVDAERLLAKLAGFLPWHTENFPQAGKLNNVRRLKRALREWYEAGCAWPEYVGDEAVDRNAES